MPRKRRTDGDEVTALPDLPPDRRDDDDAIAPAPASFAVAEERRERELDEILSEIGNDHRIRVWHVIDGKPAFAGEVGGDGFNLDTLLEVFGGGDKTLKIYRGKQLLDTAKVSLDPTVPARSPRTPRNPTGQVMQAPQPGMDGQMRMMEMMMTMMTGFGTAMTAIMEASSKGRPVERDPIETFKVMAEVMRPATQPKSTVAELKELLELGDLVASNRGDGDGTTPLIAKAIETVGKIVDSQKMQPTQRPVQRLPNPSSTVAALPTQPPTQMPVREVRLWVAETLPQLPMLKAFAGKMKPSTAAGVIAEELSDDGWKDLLADVTQDMNAGDAIAPQNCMTFAGRAVAQLEVDAGMAPWLAEVAAEVLAIANEEIEDDDDEVDTDTGKVAGEIKPAD